MATNYGPIVTSAERPELLPINKFTSPLWPPFMNEDPIANRLFKVLFEAFLEYQFQMLDPGSGEIVAAANCLPLHWADDLGSLPEEGWDWALEQGVDDARSNLQPRTLCALQIVIKPDLRGQGLSRQMLHYMKEIGRTNRLKQLIAPVRPNLKPLYPLTPIDRYVTWRREDNSAFDPWIRIHELDGARIVKPCHRSMEISGTIAQWESWTKIKFPESGDYVVAGALNPITIDRDRDRGVYVEPNVWMNHPL